MPQRYVIFDEYVSPGVAAHSSDRWNQTMGAADEITLQVVVDNVSGAGGSCDCWIEHSADGRLFLQRNDSTQTWPPPEDPGATPAGDIHLASLQTGGINIGFYSDACLGLSKSDSIYTMTGPLLAFVRVAVKTSVVGAHVRITYAGREHLA